MAQNEIPKSYDPLVQLLEDAADGARDIGVATGVKQNDEAALRAVLVALVGVPAGPANVPPAVPGLKALWNNAKGDKTAKTGAFRSQKSTARVLATSCVNILKPRLGNQWNNNWQAAGFINGSIAIPENPLTLLQQLRAYFENNPTHEVASMGLTADACEAMADLVSAASTASNGSNTAAGTAKQNLEAGIKAARSRLTGLRGELSQLLGDDDPRWYAFGFERPGDPETPEVPEHLTLVPGAPGSGSVAADWDDARRAEKYRAIVTDGVTNAEIASQLVNDSDATFTGLPLNTPLNVTITAINDAGGESQPCPPVSITLEPGTPAKAQITSVDITDNSGGGSGTISATVTFHFTADRATAYDVFTQSPITGDFTKVADAITDTQFTLDSVTGAGWAAKVVGKNAEGDGPESDPVNFSGPA